MSEPTQEQLDAAYNQGFATVSTIMGNDEQRTTELYNMVQGYVATMDGIAKDILDQSK
jgi:hypothetical protein